MSNVRRFKKYSIEELERYIATVPLQRPITNIQVHHTFLPTLAQYAATANKESVIRGMWNYHVNTNGWMDIAQHFSIAPDGVWDGRPLEWDSGGFLGAENKGGICLEIIGDFDIGREAFAGDIAENTYRTVAAILRRWPTADIRFHRDQPSAKGKKTCPGTSILKPAFVASVNLRLKPLSASAIIAEKSGIGAEGWTANEAKHPAYARLAKVVAEDWDALGKVPWIGEWFKKVGGALGN